MRALLTLPLLILLCGCSVKSSITSAEADPAETPQTKTASKQAEDVPLEKEKFSDDVFKVAPYPGAARQAYTSIEMDSDVVHSFNRTYSTTDDLDKVEAHFKSEGEKIGKYVESPLNHPGPNMRVIPFKLPNGDSIQVTASKNEKKGTVIFSVHYINPKKK